MRGKVLSVWKHFHQCSLRNIADLGFSNLYTTYAQPWPWLYAPELTTHLFWSSILSVMAFLEAHVASFLACRLIFFFFLHLAQFMMTAWPKSLAFSNFDMSVGNLGHYKARVLLTLLRGPCGHIRPWSDHFTLGCHHSITHAEWPSGLKRKGKSTYSSGSCSMNKNLSLSWVRVES